MSNVGKHTKLCEHEQQERAKRSERYKKRYCGCEYVSLGVLHERKQCLDWTNVFASLFKHWQSAKAASKRFSTLHHASPALPLAQYFHPPFRSPSSSENNFGEHIRWFCLPEWSVRIWHFSARTTFCPSYWKLSMLNRDYAWENFLEFKSKNITECV